MLSRGDIFAINIFSRRNIYENFLYRKKVIMKNLCLFFFLLEILKLKQVKPCSC